jgi:predicted PurR-regulated permease PerM
MTVSKPLLRRWLWGLGILAVFLLLAWKLERLATLALLSFLVAYVLNPLVTRLARLRFLGRTSATLITMAGLIVGILAVLFGIIPQVVDEFRLFLGRLPELTAKFQQTGIPWIEQNMGVAIPDTWDDAFTQLMTGLEDKGSEIIGPATQVATKVFGHTASAVFAVVGTLMFPLFLFFILKDFPKIVAAIDGLIPNRNRADVRELARDVDKSLSAFLHGQFTVMLVLGTLYSVGYSIVGIPVAIGVGLLTGLLCFIPYVGAATGFVIALLLALLEMKGWGSIAGVAGVFVVVQVLDAVLITPRIIGGKLGLQPLWIIIALMAGGELFGFLGVLLAVPATAVLKIVIGRTIERYRRSSLFLAATDPGASLAADDPADEPPPPAAGGDEEPPPAQPEK